MDFYNACSNGDLKTVKAFVQSGEYNCKFGICDACRGGHLEIVKFLISKSKKPDWDYYFYYACRGGCLEIIHFLIYKGANDWNWGFYGACSSGHLNIVKFLIYYVEKVVGKSLDLNYGLYGACYSKSLEIVKFLVLKIEADKVDKEINTVSNKIKCSNDLHKYYKWTEHETEIKELLYLKTPLSAFQLISGFQKLKTLVDNTKHAVKAANVLVPDLLNVVAHYIII